MPIVNAGEPARSDERGYAEVTFGDEDRGAWSGHALVDGILNLVHPIPPLPFHLPDQTMSLRPGKVTLDGRAAAAGQFLRRRGGDERPLAGSSSENPIPVASRQAPSASSVVIPVPNATQPDRNFAPSRTGARRGADLHLHQPLRGNADHLARQISVRGLLRTTCRVPVDRQPRSLPGTGERIVPSDLARDAASCR